MAVFCSARSPKTKRTEKKLAILNSDLFLPRQRAQFRAKLSSYPSLNTRPKQMTTQQLHKIQKNRYFPSSPASGPSSPRKRRTTMVAQEASSSRASSRSALATTSWSRTRDSVRTLSWDRYDAREREREKKGEKGTEERESERRESFSFERPHGVLFLSRFRPLFFLRVPGIGCKAASVQSALRATCDALMQKNCETRGCVWGVAARREFRKGERERGEEETLESAQALVSSHLLFFSLFPVFSFLFSLAPTPPPSRSAAAGRRSSRPPRPAPSFGERSSSTLATSSSLRSTPRSPGATRAPRTPSSATRLPRRGSRPRACSTSSRPAPRACAASL